MEMEIHAHFPAVVFSEVSAVDFAFDINKYTCKKFERRLEIQVSNTLPQSKHLLIFYIQLFHDIDRLLDGNI